MDAPRRAGYTSRAMANPPDEPDRPEPGAADAGRSEPEREVVLLLATADAALRRAWRAVQPPDGFRLESIRTLRPKTVAPYEPTLLLVDASAAGDADGPTAELLQTLATRCVWVGTAEALEHLDPAAVRDAYDVLVTPVSPVVLGRRLAGWARNIERTAAVERLGRRVERLAEQNSRLSARLAEAEQATDLLAEQRRSLDQALRRIHEIADLSRRINSLDVEQIATVCVEELPLLVGATRASLYLYDAAGDRLILQKNAPTLPIADRVDLHASPHSPTAVAVRTGELLLIGDFDEYQRAANVVLEREFSDRYATSSCVIVPLKAGDRVRGVLNLADKKDGTRFDERIDLPVIEMVAELIGASIYNVELYREMEHRAKTDPLTGLANRRGLEEALARETDRARRYGSSLSVLLIDVDQLKDINDRYGHAAGDAALQNLAAILLETVRSVDVPGRWGGDEFLVVLPDTSAAHAERLAVRLRQRARERPTTADDQDISTSLSIGVADYQKDESPEALVRRVDQAMYAAKQGGRDRITTAEPAE